MEYSISMIGDNISPSLSPWDSPRPWSGSSASTKRSMRTHRLKSRVQETRSGVVRSTGRDGQSLLVPLLPSTKSKVPRIVVVSVVTRTLPELDGTGRPTTDSLRRTQMGGLLGPYVFQKSHVTRGEGGTSVFSTSRIGS